MSLRKQHWDVNLKWNSQLGIDIYKIQELKRGMNINPKVLGADRMARFPKRFLFCATVLVHYGGLRCLQTPFQTYCTDEDGDVTSESTPNVKKKGRKKNIVIYNHPKVDD